MTLVRCAAVVGVHLVEDGAGGARASFDRMAAAASGIHDGDLLGGGVGPHLRIDGHDTIVGSLEEILAALDPLLVFGALLLQGGDAFLELLLHGEQRLGLTGVAGIGGRIGDVPAVESGIALGGVGHRRRLACRGSRGGLLPPQARWPTEPAQPAIATKPTLRIVMMPRAFVTGPRARPAARRRS